MSTTQRGLSRLKSSIIAPDQLLKRQWYLKSGKGRQIIPGADVDAAGAWKITKGDAKIVLAILDEAFDLEHPAFSRPGKIVSPRDYVDKKNPFPRDTQQLKHGTLCAGVSLAENKGSGLTGIAPGCSFMPVRIPLEPNDKLLIRILEEEQERQAAAMGRQLRLLRAPGLIKKVSGTHRYVLTEKGRTTITALLSARKADVDQLTKMAA